MSSCSWNSSLLPVDVIKKQTNKTPTLTQSNWGRKGFTSTHTSRNSASLEEVRVGTQAGTRGETIAGHCPLAPSGLCSASVLVQPCSCAWRWYHPSALQPPSIKTVSQTWSQIKLCYGSSAEVLSSGETLGRTKLMVKVSQHRYGDYSIFVGAALGYWSRPYGCRVHFGAICSLCVFEVESDSLCPPGLAPNLQSSSCFSLKCGMAGTNYHTLAICSF